MPRTWPPARSPPQVQYANWKKLEEKQEEAAPCPGRAYLSLGVNWQRLMSGTEVTPQRLYCPSPMERDTSSTPRTRPSLQRGVGTSDPTWQTRGQDPEPDLKSREVGQGEGRELWHHIPQPPVTRRCSTSWSPPVLGHHWPAALHTGGTSAPSTWLVAAPGLTHWSAQSPEASLTGCGPGFVLFLP